MKKLLILLSGLVCLNSYADGNIIINFINTKAEDVPHKIQAWFDDPLVGKKIYYMPNMYYDDPIEVEKEFHTSRYAYTPSLRLDQSIRYIGIINHQSVFRVVQENSYLKIYCLPENDKFITYIDYARRDVTYRNYIDINKNYKECPKSDY